MSERRSSRMDQILELLTDELEARLRARGAAPEPPKPAPPPTPPPVPLERPAKLAKSPSASKPPDPDRPAPPPPAKSDMRDEPGPDVAPAVSLPSHGSRLMLRLALGLVAVIVLINIPLTRHGLTLATAMPDTASLVVRDGLVVKEQGQPEIYVYQDGGFRWISSMDAFEHFGYTWEDVHIVPDGWLRGFEIGSPLHVLLKCNDSPHIYRLEGGTKRWIVDIQAFEAEGHKWEDVRFVTCDYLRSLPDGETIPPGNGPPPQP